MYFANNSKMKETAKMLNLPQAWVKSFDLPAGWTCPAANICLSRADRRSGKITDGPDTEVRCYAASLEGQPACRERKWENFDALKAAGLKSPADMAEAILDGIAQYPWYPVQRMHSHGDYVTAEYLQAWIMVAKQRPDMTFYGYTKRADILPPVDTLPENMRLVVSYGGKYDNMALDYYRAFIVLSVEHAELAYGIPADRVFDDARSELAVIDQIGDFALLVHGTQPAGTVAADARLALLAERIEQ